MTSKDTKSSKPEGMNEWDWTSMSENNFAELCVFHVPDKPLEHQVNDYFFFTIYYPTYFNYLHIQKFLHTIYV